jgi:hypothetical protein
MTPCRYPPHDWETALENFDEEPIETCADPLGVGGTEAVIRHGYGRAALGLIGIVAMVCGFGALLYGLS